MLNFRKRNENPHRVVSQRFVSAAKYCDTRKFYTMGGSAEAMLSRCMARGFVLPTAAPHGPRAIPDKIVLW
jgi:hypothetical protein